MRNPNGYGSVVKLSGNRRRPFTVRKTIGWNEKRQPVYQIIGYYKTREEGLIALAAYNQDPYDVGKRSFTLKALYAKWLETIQPKLGKSLGRSLKSAYRHISGLEMMAYRDIRSFQMQETIDQCGHGYATQAAIKNLWGHLDRFAMELDVISKMYSPLTTSAPIETTHRRPFTEDEIALLWDHQNEEWVDTILIMLYTGWRITEFCTLKTSSVNLENNTMTGGIKSQNGRGRIVPIHPHIATLVKHRLNPGSDYFLVDGKGKPMTAETYRRHFKETLTRYGIRHDPHETRHTFRTRLDSAGANKKCMDLLMGHKSKDVGERIYTHKTLDELRETIKLLK